MKFLLKAKFTFISKPSLITQTATAIKKQPYTIDSILPHMDNIRCNYLGNNPRLILLVSHELTLTGAPIVLQHITKILDENGWIPIVLSMKNGPLYNEFEKSGVPIVIEEKFKYTHVLKDFLSKFDYIICNTIKTYQYIEIISQNNFKCMWWIHEADDIYWFEERHLPKKLPSNIIVACGGEYAQKVLLKYRKNYNTSVLYYGLEDYFNGNLKESGDQIVFSAVGNIQYRKAQDLFVNAIMNLPELYRKKCKFYIVGDNGDELIFRNIIRACRKFPDEIIYIPQLTRSEISTLYNQSDIFVSTARDDPMPLFLVEGMMFSKPCLCSENTGIAALIHDNINGFKFTCKDPKSLIRKISFIIDHKADLDKIGTKSRKIYESFFTIEIFRSKILGIIDANM